MTRMPRALLSSILERHAAELNRDAGGGGAGAKRALPWGCDPGDLDLDLLVRAGERVRGLYGEDGYFKLDARGWEVIPPAPVLFVSNHSGGTTIPDMWGLMAAWIDRFGRDRIAHPLAHDMLFVAEPVARLLGRLGILRASGDNGRRALTGYGRDALVCPGGDREVWRPWKDRYRVNFAGRRGYAKLALRAGVPVVPVAHAGAHETLVVLSDGAPLARAMGFQKRFRAEVMPIHLSIPWGLTLGPWPHIPAPAHMRYRFGAPIPLPPAHEPSDAEVEDLDRRVQASIQAMLDQLQEEEPTLRERARHIGRVARRGVRAVIRRRDP